MTINDLMKLAAVGDSSAINVLDMIDNNEDGATTASDGQLTAWYKAGSAP